MAAASQPVASQIADASPAPAAPERPFSGLRRLLRSLIAVAVAVLLSVSVSACSGASKAAPTISPEDMALITRQAEGFLDARNRLPAHVGDGQRDGIDVGEA